MLFIIFEYSHFPNIAKKIHLAQYWKPKIIEMLPSKLEVLVEFGDDTNSIKKTIDSLKSIEGVADAKFVNGSVLIETTLPSSQILDLVNKTSGKRAVLQGFGDTQSAVAMVSSQSCCKHIMGVIRFTQTDTDPLVADGTVDGLSPGPHAIHVHESGDLSEGCKSIGGHYNPLNTRHGSPEDPPEKRHAGDLGNVIADENGRASFRIVDHVLKVSDIIGRSVGVTEKKDDLGRGASLSSKIDGDSGDIIACGIIARAAGVFQNTKRVCACDGVVVWDERDTPLAGGGRGRQDGAGDTCCKM